MAEQVAEDVWDVAALRAIGDGAMLPVEVAGQKLLLSRFGETVHAVGGTCPHAGAPLAPGVVCGHRVLCPWHKASFDLRSGARAEPPAVDPLPRYPVQIVQGRVHVTLRPTPADAPPSVTDQRCFVLLGSGAAGQSAAQTLREAGFAGRIVMVSREAELPYDRTVLSKYRLSGDQGGEKTPLQDAAFYQRMGIERLTQDMVELDAAARRVRFADGSTLAYDAALLATGGAPKRPDLPGVELDGVLLLRGPADADAVTAAAASARRVVTVGGGFIAMEVAASLTERGLHVTAVVPEAAPFTGPLGEQIGGVFTRLHESKGVTMRLREKVAAFEGDGRVSAVVLEGGERLPADLVVIGSGIQPATGFVRGFELAEDGGVAVDAHLQAAPDLYAAGDVARFPLRGDGSPIRVEHWRVAQQHGRVAALNMLGGAVRYAAVPYFWTIHYLKRLDYVGHATDWDDIIVAGDLDKPQFLACYVKGGEVQAIVGWDRDAEMARAICLMERQRGWTAAALLAAVNVPLSE